MSRRWMNLRAYALYSLGTTLLLAAVFLFYLSRTEKTIEAQAEDQLAEVTRQYTNAIATKIESDMQTVRALATAFGRLGLTDPGRMVGLIQGQALGHGYKRMGVIDASGTAHTTDHLEFDARDRLYFQRGMQGESSLAVLLMDKTDNSPINVYSVPIIRDDAVTAVLFATVRTDHFIASIDDRLFNGKGQVVVTDRYGNILFRGRGTVQLARYNNITEILPFPIPLQPDQPLPGGYGHQGLFHYEGQTFSIAHSTLDLFTRWHVYSLVPQTALAKGVGAIQREVLLLLLFFVLLSLLLVGFVMRMQWRHTRRLEKAQRVMKTIIRNIPGGFFRYAHDETQAFDYVSEGFLKLLGHTRVSFALACGNRFDRLIHEEDRQRTLDSINEQIAAGDFDAVEYRVRTTDGRLLWIFNHAQLVREEDGRAWFYVIVMDITPLREAQQELRISEERYRIVSELSEGVIFEHDLVHQGFYLSPRFREKFGYTPDREEGTGALSESCVHPEDRPRYREFVSSVLAGRPFPAELRFVRRRSEPLWCRLHAVTIFNDAGAPVRVVGDITDIDKEKRAAECLRLKAELDPLTGLYNSTAARARIAAALEEDPGTGLHALLVLDINRFKSINDTCGHLCGDQALVEMAKRLASAIRREDIAGRIGGDEFIALLRRVPSREALEQRLARLREVLSFPLPESGLRISASIGAAVFPHDGESYTALFRAADAAMYRIKKGRRTPAARVAPFPPEGPLPESASPRLAGTEASPRKEDPAPSSVLVR